MKKIISLLAAVCILTISAFAYTGYSYNVKVVVNGQSLASDVKPFVLNGRAYAPVRFIYESLLDDCTISWNQSTQTAAVSADGYYITIKAGSSAIVTNGTSATAENGIILKDGRLYAPVRTVAESLDATVSWNESTKTASIGAAGSAEGSSYSDEDLYWLSRIIEAEAAGESMTGKIAVGNVILNRVASSEFPNTIYGVIFDTKYGVQFEPVKNGTIYNTPSANSIAAAKRALSGENVAGSSLYFLNPKIASSSWIANNREYVSTIGNHVFYA